MLSSFVAVEAASIHRACFVSSFIPALIIMVRIWPYSVLNVLLTLPFCWGVFLALNSNLRFLISLSICFSEFRFLQHYLHPIKWIGFPIFHEFLMNPINIETCSFMLRIKKLLLLASWTTSNQNRFFNCLSLLTELMSIIILSPALVAESLTLYSYSFFGLLQSNNLCMHLDVRLTNSNAFAHKCPTIHP